MEGDNKAMKELLTNQFVEKAHTQLKAQVHEAMVKHPLAGTKDGEIREQVWKKLSEVDEKSGRARHTPEEAVKMVHKEYEADFQAHAKTQNWENVDDTKREEIAVKWWADKEDGEKAPVKAPGAGKIVSPTKGEKKEYKQLIDMYIKEQGVNSKGIVIEDDVWIGASATILDGVTISKGAVVAAGSVVNKKVDKYAIVAGVPAKVVGSRLRK